MTTVSMRAGTIQRPQRSRPDVAGRSGSTARLPKTPVWTERHDQLAGLIWRGRTHELEALLERGVDLSAADGEGRTLLELAAASEDFEVFLTVFERLPRADPRRVSRSALRTFVDSEPTSDPLPEAALRDMRGGPWTPGHRAFAEELSRPRPDMERLAELAREGDAGEALNPYATPPNEPGATLFNLAVTSGHREVLPLLLEVRREVYGMEKQQARKARSHATVNPLFIQLARSIEHRLPSASLLVAAGYDLPTVLAAARPLLLHALLSDPPGSAVIPSGDRFLGLSDVTLSELRFAKQLDFRLAKRRAEFSAGATDSRAHFLRDLAANHRQELAAAGLSRDALELLRSGRPPPGYEVHHKVPLEAGGHNGEANLVLIRSDVHAALTGLQQAVSTDLFPGQYRMVPFVLPIGRVYPRSDHQIRTLQLLS